MMFSNLIQPNNTEEIYKQPFMASEEFDYVMPHFITEGHLQNRSSVLTPIQDRNYPALVLHINNEQDDQESCETNLDQINIPRLIIWSNRNVWIQEES